MEGQLEPQKAAQDALGEPPALKPTPRVKPAKPSLKGAETASSNGGGVEATLERGRKTDPAPREAPVSTTQEKAHTGQRRRPAAR